MRILLFALVVLAQTASPREPAFAVVLNNGTLVPFAVFDGRRWIAPLPGISSSVNGKVKDIRTYWNRHGTQIPPQWRLVSDDGAVQAVQITGSFVEEHDGYGPNPLFRTDAPATPPESPGRLAYTGRDIIVRTPSDVLKSSDRSGWEDMIEAVLREFPRQEATATKKDRRRISASGAIELRAVFADRQGERRVIYFEAMRDHESPLNPVDTGCNGLTSVHGWVEAHGRDAPRVRAIEARLSDCDQVEIASRRAVGIVSLNGDEIWILEESHYEGLSYALFSTRRGFRRLLQTWIFSF